MNNWTEFRIDEIGTVVGGGTPSTKIDDYWNGDVPWLTPYDLSKNKFKFVSFGERFISRNGLNKSSAKILPKDTILFTSRAPIGYKAIAENEMCTNQGFQSIIVKKDIADTNFIYYLLDIHLDGIKSIASGATFPEVSNSKLRAYKLRLPPLPIQQRIASILSAYDDLIENNLKRIKLLEELAQRTYEEWFVKFRINGEQLPIDENTGLPFGWETKQFKDFGEIITGKTPSTSIEEYYNGDVQFIKTPDMSGYPFVIETTQTLSMLGAKTQPKKFIPKNSLMISCIGTAGVFALTSENCQTNQQINSIIFKEEYFYIYFYCFAKNLKPILEAIGSNGATMTNVNKSKFEELKIVDPLKDTLTDFYLKLKPNFDMILNLQKQNYKLKESRNLLLPRLMNGTIKIDEP